MKQYIILGVITVAIVVTSAFITSLVLVGDNQPAQVGGNTRFPNSDLTAKSVTATGGSSSFATTTVKDLYVNPVAVSTTTTGGNAATLSQADLHAGHYYVVNINQAADFTYTLPATSTLTTLIPNTGNSGRWCFHNATSSDWSLKFAVGTGIDLERTSTTTPGLSIGSTNTGCFELTRSGNASGTVTTVFEITGDVD